MKNFLKENYFGVAVIVALIWFVFSQSPAAAYLFWYSIGFIIIKNITEDW